MLNYKTLRVPLRRPMRLYVEYGINPGSFLTAVLCNQLFQSFANADAWNLAAMQSIVGWVYDEMPSTIWGDPERVASHINQKAKERGKQQ